MEYYSDVINASESYLELVPAEDRVVDALSVDSTSDEDDNDIATAEVVLPGDDDVDEEDAVVEVFDPTGSPLPLPPLPPPKTRDIFCEGGDEIGNDADDMSSSSGNDIKDDSGDSEYLPDEPVKKSLRSHFNGKGQFNCILYLFLFKIVSPNLSSLFFLLSLVFSDKVKCREGPSRSCLYECHAGTGVN